MASRVYRFCQITSIKGISRLLRARSFFMRVIWTISIMGFLCVAVFHAAILTIEYLHYKTYTFTGEVLMGHFEKNIGIVGNPDVTLCNANPFASNKSLNKDIPTMSEYYKLAEKATACDDNCTEEECDALKSIRKEILSTGGYFDFIGRLNAEELGHSRESFVAHCALEMEAGVYGHHIPCLEASQIIQIQLTQSFNCYTIRLPRNTLPDKMYVGFLVVLHLDDYDVAVDEQVLLTPHQESGQIAGVWMFVHERSTTPHMFKNRILLQPGHFYDIPIKMVLRTHLPRPHGECKNTGAKYYDTFQCYVKCLQTHIYKRCGCLDLQNYTSQSESIDRNVTTCLSISSGKSQLARNWRCALKEKMKGFSVCEERCPTRCKVMRYILRVFQYLP